jgi:uncharacterized protein (TIGR03435 family)
MPKTTRSITTRKKPFNIIKGLFLPLVVIGSVAGQDTPMTWAFDVASVKQNFSPPGSGAINVDQARFSSTNVPLRPILVRAYKIKAYQIVGPSWLNTDRYDIIATIPKGAPMEQIPAMLQNLLEERFQMRVHRESKEESVYALVVGKNGPKLKKSEDTYVGSKLSFSSRGHLEAKNLPALAALLSSFMDRPVIDVTGVQGNFDIKLEVSIEDLVGLQKMGSPINSDGEVGMPSGNASSLDDHPTNVFAAIKELGLELESRKAPIEHIFIDKIEKVPTEN